MKHIKLLLLAALLAPGAASAQTITTGLGAAAIGDVDALGEQPIAEDPYVDGENPGGGIRAWLGKGKNLKWGEGNILARGEFWSVRVEDMNGDNIPDAMATGKGTGILIWEGLGKGKMNRMASPVSTVRYQLRMKASD